MTTIFLVFETTNYEGDSIDEDTKAFHTREAAEAYVTELESADKAKRVTEAKEVLANMEDKFNKSFYKGMTEDEIVEMAPIIWEIKEISLM
jgi:hypothetical protein